MKPLATLVIISSILAWSLRSPARAADRRYSDMSTDEIITRLEDGNTAATNDILALGTRNDPRIFPLLRKAAAKHESYSRRAIRKADPSGRSELANEDYFRSIEKPVELASLKAMARLGDEQAFNQFVLYLSSSTGDFRVECIDTMFYIGDRAAIRHLVPIMDDDRPLYETSEYSHHRPGNYSDVAMSTLRRLMPDSEVPVALRGFYSAAEWRPPLKLWWARHKSRYAAMPFGAENIHASVHAQSKTKSHKP